MDTSKTSSRKVPSKKLVLTAQGRRDINLVALARLVAAACTIVTLVRISDLIGTHFSGDPVPGSAFALPLATAALGALAAFAEIFYGGFAARAEETRIRRRLLTSVFDSPSSSENDEVNSADLLTLMTDNAERLTEYRQVYFGATVAAILVPFGTLAYIAVAFNWIVGISLIVLAILVPVLIRFFMKLFRKTSAKSRKERAELAGRYLDAIRNLVLLRLLGAGPRVEADLRAQGERNRGAIMKLLAGNQVVIIVMDGLFSLLLICSAAALSIWQYTAGNLSLVNAVSIMFLTTLLVEPLVQVAGFFYIGMGGMASERKIAAYLRKQAEIGDGIAASVRKDSLISVSDPSSGMEISVDNVRFDYGRGPVLKGVSLQVPQGSKAAIIGRSGAGKSTLLSLLRGTLPLQAGWAAVGGQALAAIPPADIRELTASVSQKTWLFTGTIADNLRLAAPNATEKEMWAALESAQVADEVARMPLGLLTDVGEQGRLISGGQAQRISLARALLSGRRVLILDEPTSQIDVESEERLIAALADLGPEWTVLMVTHRPSLLRIADETWEMEGGELRRAPVLIGQGK